MRNTIYRTHLDLSIINYIFIIYNDIVYLYIIYYWYDGTYNNVINVVMVGNL